MKYALIFLLACTAVFSLVAQGIESVPGDSRSIVSSEFLTISWLYPKAQDTVIEGKNITVQLGYSSKYDVTDMSLLINGLPVTTGKRGVGFVKKFGQYYYELIERNVDLKEGRNELALAIRDSFGNVLTTERNIFVSVPQDSILLKRKDFALLFANDEYDEWDNLNNPINDAQAIASELKANYGFNVEIVKNSTQDVVIAKLREYAMRSYNELDQLLIFFAGHGVYDELFGQGYLVCANSKRNDEAKISFLSHSVLRQIIDNIPAYHTLLLMDVCFGGTFDPKLFRGAEDKLSSEIGTNAFIKRKLRMKTRKYITSGGKEYVPDGRPGMHSPFVNQILLGLQSNGGRDNIITLHELYSWLERIDPEPRIGGFGDDNPGSDFLFVSNPKN